MMTAKPIEPAAAELLLEREAKSIQVPAVARMGLALFGGLTALNGVPSLLTKVVTWLFLAAIILINAASIYALRRRRHLSLVGWLGVGFDVLVVLLYPLISRGVLTEDGLHWAYARGVTD